MKARALTIIILITRNRSLRKSVSILTLSCVALSSFSNIFIILVSFFITLVTFCVTLISIAKSYWIRVGKLILTPLNAALICRIKEVTLLVLSYSRTQLATASPYATGILCASAVAEGCSIVGKDSSESGEEDKEAFVDKLVEANWYCNCSKVGSILEVSSDKEASDFGRISLRFFCCISGCDYMEFGAYFLFIRGPNSRVFVGCLYSCCGC
jgi:hypothetical protein